MVQAFEYAVDKAPLYVGITDDDGRCCRPARWDCSAWIVVVALWVAAHVRHEVVGIIALHVGAGP